MKKWLHMFLILAILAAACGQQGAQGSDAGKDDGAVPELAASYPEFGKFHSVDVTWFEQGWTGIDTSIDIITPEIERKTNLWMNYIGLNTPTEDDYNQKLNLMVASNDVPEVFFGGSNAYTRLIYEKLGQAGQIWELGEIVKDYPLLYDLVEPELNLYRTEDGKNYFIPTQTGRGYEIVNEPPHGLYLRQDFLDMLGMDLPTNAEELYDFLKASKDLVIDGQPVTPFLLGENLGGLAGLMDLFIPLMGRQDSSGLPFDTQDNYKVKNYYYTNSPELLEAAQYVNKISREGLFDREALTIKQAQFLEKGSSGYVAAFSGSWWDMNTFADALKPEFPDIFWVNPGPIYSSSEVRASRMQPWTHWVGCWSSIIISKSIDEETLRHFLATLDWFGTQEGQMLVQVGIEGETYTWDDEGKYVFTPEFLEKTGDLDWNKAAAYGVGYYAQLVNNTPMLVDYRDIPSALQREDNMANWQLSLEWWNLFDSDMEPTKDYYFVPGPVENEKFPAIRDAQLEFLAKVVAA
ncbi:MAG: extracellular solute-binding protein, partial [Clostridiales bacterium]|nr:extracellular solute-binding protein [Clostridiales bacterium]